MQDARPAAAAQGGDKVLQFAIIGALLHAAPSQERVSFGNGCVSRGVWGCDEVALARA